MADPGAYLFSGLSRAGNSIAQGMQNFDQLKKEDKVAKALFDALTPDDDPLTGETPAHPMKINKDAFNAMSAKERIAATQGFMKATALQEATQELQMKREALQGLAESEKDLKGALQETVQTTSEEAKDIGPGPKPFNTRRFAQLIAEKYPAAARHPRLPQLLEMFGQEEAGFSPEGGSIEVDGWRIPFGRTSKGQAQFFSELATSGGKSNPRYSRDNEAITGNARLASIDKELASLNDKYVLKDKDLERRNELMQMKKELMEGKPSKAQNEKKPETPASPYPEGTELIGPDGKKYVVRGGQPVLVQ